MLIDVNFQKITENDDTKIKHKKASENRQWKVLLEKEGTLEIM